MLLLAAPTGESMLPAPKTSTGIAISLGALAWMGADAASPVTKPLRRGPERLAYIKRRWKEIQDADLPAVDGDDDDDLLSTEAQELTGDPDALEFDDPGDDDDA